MTKKMTKDVLEKALKDALVKIDKLWEDVHGNFPTHNSTDNVYGEVGNPPEGGGGWMADSKLKRVLVLGS